MTYVRNYERPDLFVTFTCNPEWPEIKVELLTGQRSFDRQDIISRWQKRGLPHCRLLFWLERKIQPDEIDSFIFAELPNQQNDPILYDIVNKNMVHGPCGEHNFNSTMYEKRYLHKKVPSTFRQRYPKRRGRISSLSSS
ncbi:unnamed protein product [Macrosiphum euphorbiae]|uniref:Helitron helicase-like domain-containing protein n=1 Tax=Macrosiphum euphorbiae TaxID=13131 RepID=A0AAV0WYY8_9HEMI|nr:unnamed protein product [Macrosiphum euphorbiae]